jgi:hypothetical protein
MKKFIPFLFPISGKRGVDWSASVPACHERSLWNAKSAEHTTIQKTKNFLEYKHFVFIRSFKLQNAYSRFALMASGTLALQSKISILCSLI